MWTKQKTKSELAKLREERSTTGDSGTLSFKEAHEIAVRAFLTGQARMLQTLLKQESERNEEVSD